MQSLAYLPGGACSEFHRAAARLGLFICLMLGGSSPLPSQTTQGLISGQVRDSLNDQPLEGAKVDCTNLGSGLTTTASTDGSGVYTFPVLSPGAYRLRVEIKGYQAQELYDLPLAVGGRLSVPFHLRPLNDVWEKKQEHAVVYPESNHVVTFFGPDVDPNRSAIVRANRAENSNLDTSVSAVIDSRQIQNLPLLGRDVYTLLVSLPAVTAATSSGRGINVSVAGQRPSASNFLLDGIESNNYLVTGPLAALSPEAIQEYRISTNNYSAEYGRTSSFIANAISRPGAGNWHGTAFAFLKNDLLNANGFQQNRGGVGKAPLREVDAGASLGGPILKDRLFTQTSVEHIRFRSRQEPQTFILPTRSFAGSLDAATAAGQLLKPLSSSLPEDATASAAEVAVTPATELNRTSAVERLDFIRDGGKQHITTRAAWFNFTQPGILFNPYPGFSSDLRQRTASVMVGWTFAVTPRLSNEIRAGRSGQRFTFDRPHAEVPVLQSFNQVRLPGSLSFAGFRQRDRTWELLDNVAVARGRHFYRFGAGWLHRSIESALTGSLPGSYVYRDLQAFSQGLPASLRLTFDRFSNQPISAGDAQRAYTYRQAYAFAQGSSQVTRGLTLNYGVRYEYFGAPSNVGPAKDALLQLGEGANFEQRFSRALFALPKPGTQQIYSAVEANWAGRFAFAFDPRRNGKSVIRGSYGMFYDRPFDNYWQSVTTNANLTGFLQIRQPVDFRLPVREIAAANPPRPLQGPIDPVLLQPNLRAARVQSVFIGFEQRLSDAVSLQLIQLGGSGRGLITTDRINRPYSVADIDDPANPLGRINPGLPQVSYRANQGKSSYVGTAATLRYRWERATGQVSYTLSHAIDNQSDPLAGAFSNYNFGPILTSGGSPTLAAFTRQFDSEGDRGDADFDQRHNLVFTSVVESPVFSRPMMRRFAGSWRLGAIGAFRSGFPYSVRAPQSGGILLPVHVNNRVNLVTAPSAAYTSVAVDGGRKLLNQAAFEIPNAGTIGNTGRNAFRGPGLYNIDLSVARDFALTKIGETGRVTLRADFFNVLNHSNLNNPCAAFGAVDCDFGTAFYGRSESNSGFPLLTPLTESPRQIQLMLRVTF